MGTRIYINNPPPHVQFLSSHRSVRLHRKPSIIFSTLTFNGSSNGLRFNADRTLVRHISTAEHRIARAILECARARAMIELLNWRLSSRFCFRVAKPVYQVKKQYSTANTVLLLPLTTKKQYHTALNPTNTKINNSTTVPLYMTPTYNSKTAIQYHMISNNCPLFPLLAKHPFPFLLQIRTLRQVANKLHGYIYSALDWRHILCGHISTCGHQWSPAPTI